MTDEGRMLSPKEARLRKAARKSKAVDTPRVKFSFEKVRERPNRRDYSGIISVGTKRSPQQAKLAAELAYSPKIRNIQVLDLYPIEYKGKRVPIAPYEDQFIEFANKIFPKPAVKASVEKAAKMFPNAKNLFGLRATGLHAVKGRAHSLQSFNLSGIRKRLARSGKYGKALGLGTALYQAYQGLQEN